MMSGEFTETQYSIIKEICETNGFKEYELEEYSTTAKGDNYSAQIVCVTVKNNDKKLEIVVKKAPTNENFRKAFPLSAVFFRENYVYEKVLKYFVEFQQKNGLKKPFSSFPKLYATCNEKYSECLILENLVKNGYKHWNRKLPMNSDHIALVLTEYGKLHAVAFAMRKQNPEVLAEMSEVLTKAEKDTWKDEDTKIFLRNCCTVLEKTVKGSDVLEQAYQRLALNVEKYFLEETQEPKDKMVITHGDAWCNNMLFKYEDPDDKNKPTQVSLIDWQMSKYGLPVQDLVHFFYASSSRATMNDYKIYQRIYYSSLSKSLTELSCNVEELFPFEELESLWKKFGKYAILICSFVYRLLCVDSQNVPEVQKETTTMQDFFDQFESMAYSHEVKKRVVELFDHMIENDFV